MVVLVRCTRTLDLVHDLSCMLFKIGSGVSIGHLALLHGCTIEDDVLIGMRAVIMDSKFR